VFEAPELNYTAAKDSKLTYRVLNIKNAEHSSVFRVDAEPVASVGKVWDWVASYVDEKHSTAFVFRVEVSRVLLSRGSVVAKHSVR
jgi:hypothetical protein